MTDKRSTWKTAHVIKIDCRNAQKQYRTDVFAICHLSRTIPDPMPPWVASVPRPTTYSRAPAIDRIATLLRGRNATKRAVPLKFRVRSASTLVSPTAINYRPNVPPKNEELYNALSGLSGAAEQYVNLSRLQLALRGLATENAVTRVAGALACLV